MNVPIPVPVMAKLVVPLVVIPARLAPILPPAYVPVAVKLPAVMPEPLLKIRAPEAPPPAELVLLSLAVSVTVPPLALMALLRLMPRL